MNQITFLACHQYYNCLRLGNQTPAPATNFNEGMAPVFSFVSIPTHSTGTANLPAALSTRSS